VNDHTSWRLYQYVMAAYAVLLLLSNIVAVKLVPFGPFVWAAGIVIFPITYILGDVITEVYGYAGARRIIWVGVLANILMVVVFYIAAALPALDPDLNSQFQRVLLSVPRIVVASICGVWVGQFVNAFVMSRMKILTKGRWLWSRTITSTLFGETADSAVFTTLAFGGTIPWSVILTIVLSMGLFKSLYEASVTPLTYLVIGYFKRVEGEVVDQEVSYNPFNLRDKGGVLWHQ